MMILILIQYIMDIVIMVGTRDLWPNYHYLLCTVSVSFIEFDYLIYVRLGMKGSVVGWYHSDLC